MSGFQSKRTGAATQALLDQVEKQCLMTEENKEFSQNFLLYATGSGRRTLASDRITKDNAVIAPVTMTNQGIAICTTNNNLTNAVTTNSGVQAGLAEISVQSDGSARIVSNTCNLEISFNLEGGTDQSIITIFNNLRANRLTLVGVYLKFKFNSQDTHAIISSEYGTKIGASFMDGTNVYHLMYDYNTGAYSIQYLYNSENSYFLVADN